MCGPVKVAGRASQRTGEEREHETTSIIRHQKQDIIMFTACRTTHSPYLAIALPPPPSPCSLSLSVRPLPLFEQSVAYSTLPEPQYRRTSYHISTAVHTALLDPCTADVQVVYFISPHLRPRPLLSHHVAIYTCIARQKIDKAAPLVYDWLSISISMVVKLAKRYTISPLVCTLRRQVAKLPPDVRVCACARSANSFAN